MHPGKTKTTFQPFNTIDFVIGYNRKTRVFEEHYGMSVIALRKQRKIILHTKTMRLKHMCHCALYDDTLHSVISLHTNFYITFIK